MSEAILLMALDLAYLPFFRNVLINVWNHATKYKVGYPSSSWKDALKKNTQPKQNL